MTKAVFTTSEGSAYDDQPESRYHFPRTYLQAAQQAIGDLIVYYEPRRTAGPNSGGGRQSYFAIAKVVAIEPDSVSDQHFYARISDYLEFDQPVPFKLPGTYFESKLEKADGSTSKGAFGRAVRLLPDHEFAAIVRAGFGNQEEPWETGRVEEPVAEYEIRPLVTQVVTRPFRDKAFKRHVRLAYDNTCAISGMSLINGRGRPEVQAAHIRPVEADGPDTVRNGIALTGTLHWLFDRGLISISDDYRVLVSSNAPQSQLSRLFDGKSAVRVPARVEHRPHPTYLRWHRENCFKP